MSEVSRLGDFDPPLTDAEKTAFLAGIEGDPDIPTEALEADDLTSAIERYADQLRDDAKTADDGVAVGLLRAADGLGDLLAATEDRTQDDPWDALDGAMRPVLAQALAEEQP